MRRLIVLAILLSAILFESFGQKYDFRRFSSLNGLPDNVVYAVNQDLNGFLWVGTGTGLFRFDGFVFRRVEFPVSTSNIFATVIFRDRTGTIWVGASDGSLFYAAASGLIRVNEVESQRINDIIETPEGELYVVTQNAGIFSVAGPAPYRVKHMVPPEGLLLYSLCLTKNGTIFAGTQENLVTLQLSDTGIMVDKVVQGIEYARVSSIIATNDGSSVLAGTDGYGLYSCSPESEVFKAEKIDVGEGSDYLRVQSLYNDRDGKIWIPTTGSGVLKISFDGSGKKVENIIEYNTITGLAGDDARSVYQDNEGNFWIALYGGGLNQLVSEAFTFVRPGDSNDENNIIFIGQQRDNYVLGTPAGYHTFDFLNSKSTGFINLAGVTSGVPATSYHLDRDGSLWIGTGGGGLYVKTSGRSVRKFFDTANSGENHIAAVTSRGNEIWLSTRNGVIVIDRQTGAKIKSFTTSEKLPHNNINQVFIDSDGKALIATEATGIFEADIKDGVTSGNIEISGVVRNVIQGFAQTSEGGYLLATLGNGVIYLNGDSVRSLSTADGMMSNYCYSILADTDKKIWVGHERGFSRFDPTLGNMSVFSTSFAGGGDCNPNSIFESSDGTIMVGTTGGLIIYDRKKDQKGSYAPINNIVSVTIGDSVYPYMAIYKLPYAKYVVKVAYVGISLSNPGLIKYRTMLGNYDEVWSSYSNEREVTYRLPDGSFRFSMESVSESGISSVTQGAFEIIVKRPLWRRWWFIIIVVSILGVVVALIIRIREENQRKMRLLLEKELQERTKEVVRQKEEIELQNTEITDSINYARRIQSSILPDVSRLTESFPEAFIVFIPRDIVSGDFYWFDRVGEDRFIVVCADSTGHGVPGAFMSMIGSTLIQDIVTRKNVTRPSEILTLLDKQIFSTLNRNLDVGVSNDGMDMVVCEFNIKTRQLRFASAMRPVIIIMGGEPVYIKGNRSSVGGTAYTEKFFDDQEYYLDKGDAIYLFSDGFPDQFGGEDGKKMKVVRLKKLIESLADVPMSKQQEYITNFFYSWKGDHEQVDDILFMGIRV